jgi:hypothetical protein
MCIPYIGVYGVVYLTSPVNQHGQKPRNNAEPLMIINTVSSHGNEETTLNILKTGAKLLAKLLPPIASDSKLIAKCLTILLA